jgi:hypothetical protein
VSLAFLSPGAVAPEVRLVSPLQRALAGQDAVRDVSALGKIELRGDLERVEVPAGAELIRITPRRALLVCEPAEVGALLERLRPGIRAYDATGALAGLELEGERLFRRLSDLDPAALPAAGPVARGVPALVTRRGAETFRILCPQELGHYVAEVVLDLRRGLAESGEAGP